MFLWGKKNVWIISLTESLIIALLIAASCYTLTHPQDAQYTINFLTFNDISLHLSLQLDMLAKIMVIFILMIGYFIYHYAQNYLSSDSTRLRFLAQLNLVFISVLLLVMSANLLTAFIAWQFIGISLYLLLNHYHYDPVANRAAKKKFVISRFGDCSFLLAILLTYQTQTADSFAAIQSSPHAFLICVLIFISVLTKCAQFPFHIWLIDTMETPTPVSALMHAGIINAGGILLTRISGTLIQFDVLTYTILFLGLINAVLSMIWMNQQADIKKKLAYSTMGQMGYMLMQCALGAFPAAVFHLISHGFYKASLFLNAGEALCQRAAEPLKQISHGLLLKSSLVSTLILISGLLFLGDEAAQYPVLMYGFLWLTMLSLILKANRLPDFSISHQGLFYAVVAVFFNVYLCALQQVTHWLVAYEYPHVISDTVQWSFLALVAGLQYLVWCGKSSFITSLANIKDGTEQFLRDYLLHPFRWLGNLPNHPRYQQKAFMLYTLLAGMIVVLFCDGLFHYKALALHHTQLYETLMFVFLLTGAYALVVANRCVTIQSLLLFLALFELSFTNLALFDGSPAIAKIGLFHLVTTGPVLLLLRRLSDQKICVTHKEQHSNRLPSRVFYLVFSLLLLIGVPGTASFISELYLLDSLTNGHTLFVPIYISLMMLLAIVIMHSLQLYGFNKNYLNLLAKPIKGIEHCMFLLIIFFDVVCGLWPDLLLNLM